MTDRDPLFDRLRRIGHPLDAPPRGAPWNEAELAGLVGPPQDLCEAAVLVPVVDRGGSPHLLLTRRTDGLRHHAGQISFPGGRIETADGGPLQAALREAEEEIGLPRDATEAVGYLDPLATITGFRVVPVLGLVRGDPPLRPDPGEVAEAFEVPLAFALDPANLAEHQREFRGRMRRYHAIHWRHYEIWGATASMIANLSRRLREE
jgi:8-oxo-dGTP pyrophosphatase MutT (NUDIX family)